MLKIANHYNSRLKSSPSRSKAGGRIFSIGEPSGMVKKDATSTQSSWYRPVIASSGAGKVEHFSEVFQKTKAEAALAAGIFHREEVPIEAVKNHMRDEGIETR